MIQADAAADAASAPGDFQTVARSNQPLVLAPGQTGGDFQRIASLYQGDLPLVVSPNATFSDFSKVAAQPLKPPPRATRADETPVAKAAPADKSATDQSTTLADARKRIASELSDNPDLNRKLMASIQAEVGDQGPAARLAYTESVFNRAIARNQSLDQTISDRGYYPKVTLNQLGRNVSNSEADYLKPIVDYALSGSNVTNFATGNESGNVHSAGAKVTYNPGSGERFVLENPDVGWHKKLVTGGTTASPTNDTLAAEIGPVHLAAPVTRDLGTLMKLTSTGQATPEDISDLARKQADDFATTMAKAGTPLTVDEYKQQLSLFYSAGQKQNVGFLPERLPEDQVDSLSSLHQGMDLAQSLGELQKKVWDKSHPPIPGVPLNIPIDQTNEYKAFDSARQLAISSLARGVGGQKGVLTDNDVKIMKDALPNEHDNPTQVAAKLANLNNQSLTMMRDKLAYLKAAHYDTAPFEQPYLSAKAQFQSSNAQTSADSESGLNPQQKAVKQQTWQDKVQAKINANPITPPPPMTGGPGFFDTNTNQVLPPTQQQEQPFKPMIAESLIGSD